MTLKDGLVWISRREGAWRGTRDCGQNGPSMLKGLLQLFQGPLLAQPCSAFASRFLCCKPECMRYVVDKGNYMLRSGEHIDCSNCLGARLLSSSANKHLLLGGSVLVSREGCRYD